MNRVLVYEYLSAGPFAPQDDPGEALLPEGLAMRDAVAADLAASGDCAVTVASRPGLPAPGACAAVHPLPGESPFDFVAREARRHDAVWVIAPETDGVLERFCRVVPPSRWIGCRPGAIAIAASKRRTADRIATHGVTTPLAFGADATAAARWVVKPDDGAGSQDTVVHGRLADAAADRERRERAGRPAALEPWVEGDPLSVSLLCGPHAAHLLSINRQRIEIDDAGRVGFSGVEHNVVPRHDPRRLLLAALAQRVVQAIPGLRGFVGIDAVWHQKRGPVAIEVNPRVTTAYVGLSAVLGRNLAAAILAGHRETAHAG